MHAPNGKLSLAREGPDGVAVTLTPDDPDDGPDITLSIDGATARAIGLGFIALTDEILAELEEPTHDDG